MRIKCPNSDIVLELPGDRTDMKFTCPACHKIHRVTITIATPGEDPPVNAVTKTTPQMPKKYATGAYAPVVDIPIDANFILVDPHSASQQGQGIDLGKAAKPQSDTILDEGLSNRKTEIISDKDEDKKRSPSASASQRNKSGRLVWDDDDAPPPPPPPAATPPPAQESASTYNETASSYAAPKRRAESSGFRNTLFVLLLTVLGAGGYLGWQQYQFSKTTQNAEKHLGLADTAWNRGDIATATSDAKNAHGELQQGDLFNTPHKLWNQIAASTGMVEPSDSPVAELRGKVEQYLDREENFNVFRAALNPADAGAMAALLQEAKDKAGQDSAFADALEKATIDIATTNLATTAATLPPEDARAQAHMQQSILAPTLSDSNRRDYENRLSSFADSQRRRLVEQVRSQINALAERASSGNASALEQYQKLSQRIRHADSPELTGYIPNLADRQHRDTLTQLDKLSNLVDNARRAARTVLSQEDSDTFETDALVDEAKKLNTPVRALADSAVKMIEDTNSLADDLLGLRIELYGRLQSEMRRNRENPGTRMAWSMLRTAFDDREVEIDPASVKYDSNRASMNFSMRGIPASMDLGADDYEEKFSATFAGYTFETGWRILFHKPLSWMADLAAGMQKAKIDPAAYPAWELLEGPGGPLALSLQGAAGKEALGSIAQPPPRRLVFFDGKLLPVNDVLPPSDAKMYVDDFRKAAERLETEVMEDSSVSQSLRQALKPILMGTYQKPDSRDFFDSAFCRRLIEANYLETFITPMPSGIKQRLDEYRHALAKLEAGYDEFSVVLPEKGGTLYGVNRPDQEFSADGKSSDQDPDSGETLPRLTWRIEKENETVFFSPQPARFVYAFMLADYYSGRHRVKPAGVPTLTEVWHATHGRIASYKTGDAAAEGDTERWRIAIEEDLSGRFDPTMGPPGWNYPLHVLQRDDQDDPVLLATPSGVVKSPDFSAIPGIDARRAAEDKWLDSTAATLAEPGELGLIFHQFFRYCSDSPMPELPNLIGSHFGLSDTHQTVYESLERRWVGRLIGDCDDLAEFFQELTRRQGKLSHVMQLPGHAACGYVDKINDDEYRFVVLQTGPVLQFEAGTVSDVVELAYRSFDRGEGMSHMTTDAVPLLLRFADEQTRTPFVLSSRIYWDEEYADRMIEVQSYWHEHAYSAAIKIMEDMIKEDQEVGNIKELGSLYERVGFYDKSGEMRRRELEMVRDNPQQELSTLLEIAQLHMQDKDNEKALEALSEMEDVMRRMIRMDDAPEFYRAMTFRSYWAMLMARIGEADRAWGLVRYDAIMTKRQLGRVAEPVLRTMVVLYDRMRLKSDAAGEDFSYEQQKAMDDVRKELDEAFGRGYFKSDDSYNNIISRYFVLGRYAVSDIGRDEGLRRLRLNGPYPTEAKDQTKRTRGLDDEDWKWFRITPQLYLAMGMEMLDEDEYPEFYNPDAARPLLEDVTRAIDKGTGLGSDVAGGDDAIKAELTLSFLNNDIAAFRRAMATVKEKDYSSLYDDAAMTFGLNCGLIPLSDFGQWAEAFREFFPGTQHYFKVVYRAIDKEHYDHALAMAEATARFFPSHELLLKEAAFVRSIIPGLKERKLFRRYSDLKASELPIEGKAPAA